MWAVVAIEGVVIVLLTVLVAGLLRSHAEILRRLHELGAGDDHVTTGLMPTARPKKLADTPADSIVGVTPEGVTTAVSLSGSRGFTLLAFLSSGCRTCQTFWSEFGSRPSPRTDVRVFIVTKSAVDESLSDVRKLAPLQPTTVMSTDAWQEFEVPFTPYFVLVDNARGAVVGDGAAAGWTQLLGLVDRAMGDAETEHDLHRSSGERIRDTDEELSRSGIEPGDPVLYRKPEDGV